MPLWRFFSTFCSSYALKHIDDILIGCNDRDQLRDIKKQLVELLGKGSFLLHRRCSNVPEILDDIISEKWYYNDIVINKNGIIKSLDLKYDLFSDLFTFTMPECDLKLLQTKTEL